MVLKSIRWSILWTGIFAVVITILPFIPINEWWIRIWDFPRLQIATVLVAVLVAVPFLTPLRRLSKLALIVILTGALAWQGYRIWPYTLVASIELEEIASCRSGFETRLLVANVLADNENTQPLFDIIDRVKPSLIFLVETNSWWDRHLEPLGHRYPHAISRPQENGYGMHLFSQLELVDPEVRFLIDDYVPSIKTGVRLPSGAVFTLYGVHPTPPPRDDTARRDAELLIVARDVREQSASAMVVGDLNDVGWSQTTRLFKEVSGMLDPRIGRGMYPTFNAQWPVLRWPLDHVLVDDSFQLLHFGVMDDIGSDHFPVFATVCHTPLAPEPAKPNVDASEMQDASEAIDEGRDQADE